MNETRQARIFLRGDLYYADFGEGTGSEQGGVRPVVLLQNNIGNKHAPTLIVAPLTTKQTKAKIPTHSAVPATCGVPRDSVVLLEQVRVIDKTRIVFDKIGHIDDMTAIDKGLKISLGLR